MSAPASRKRTSTVAGMDSHSESNDNDDNNDNNDNNNNATKEKEQQQQQQQQQHEEELKSKLVQHLKDFQRISNHLQDQDLYSDLLDSVQISKTKAMKQWYLKAADFKDMKGSSSTSSSSSSRSTLYDLQDIIQKAEERHGIQELYERVFDSKEAFQVMTKAEMMDDPGPHFVKYKRKKQNQLSIYLQRKIQNLVKDTTCTSSTEANNEEGTTISTRILKDVEAEFIQVKEDSLMNLKASFWNGEDEREREEQRNNGNGNSNRPQLQRAHRNLYAMELAGQELSLKIAKEIASALLFGNFPSKITHHNLF